MYDILRYSVESNFEKYINMIFRSKLYFSSIKLGEKGSFSPVLISFHSFSFSYSFATKFSPNSSNHLKNTQTFLLQIDS